MVTSCPLCHSEQAVRLSDVAYGDIWNALAAEWGASIPESLRRRFESSQPASLVACAECELWYFRGATAGDGEFYRELMKSPLYYHRSWNWDFESALSLVPRGARLLDVGCGPGTFIEGVRRAGGHPVGVDLNESSVAEARAKGLDARIAHLDEFAAANRAGFDVVTMLHVLEHVEDATRFAVAAAETLRPGGTMIVSVPFRERKLARHLEPLDCPPHHVSRWSGKQLERLGALLGMKRHQVFYDVFEANDLAAHVESRVAALLSLCGAGLPARVARLAARTGGRVAHGPLRRSGWLLRNHFVRQSVMVTFCRAGTR